MQYVFVRIEKKEEHYNALDFHFPIIFTLHFLRFPQCFVKCVSGKKLRQGLERTFFLIRAVYTLKSFVRVYWIWRTYIRVYERHSEITVKIICIYTFIVFIGKWQMLSIAFCLSSFWYLFMSSLMHVLLKSYFTVLPWHTF